MLPSRVAVRAPLEAVTTWGTRQPGRCLVTDAGDGWTIADLDGPSDESLAAELGQDVYVSEDADVWRLDPTGASELMPMWVEDPTDELELAAFDQAWQGIPDLLLGADARLTPPRARQTLVMPTLGEEELSAAVTGMALPVTVVEAGAWTVVAADEDLVAVAAGLTASRRRWGLVLSTDGELVGVQVVSRGRLRREHVWNRSSALVGLDALQGSPWQGLFTGPVDADELASLVGTPTASDNVSLIRAALRRRAASQAVLDELLVLLGLGDARGVAADALGGKPLIEHDRARRIEPASSFAEFLRAGASGAFLDAATVPWFSILAAVCFPVLVGLFCVRFAQLLTGTLDGWGVAQLVGSTINAPLAFLYVRRVLRWRGLRRGGDQP